MWGRTAVIIALIATSEGGSSQTLLAGGERCDAGSGRVLQGRVLDAPDSLPVPRAVVSLPGGRCAVLADESGYFRMTGFPDGVDRLLVTRLGFPGDTVPILPPTGEDPHVTLVTTRIPDPMLEVHGVEGCYWFGGGRLAGKILELRGNGVVAPRGGQPLPHTWSWDEASEGLRFWLFRTPDAGEVVEVTIGASPDWGALEVTIRGANFAAQEYVLRTVAVRVPCAGEQSPG